MAEVCGGGFPNSRVSVEKGRGSRDGKGGIDGLELGLEFRNERFQTIV